MRKKSGSTASIGFKKRKKLKKKLRFSKIILPLRRCSVSAQQTNKLNWAVFLASFMSMNMHAYKYQYSSGCFSIDIPITTHGFTIRVNYLLFLAIVKEI